MLGPFGARLSGRHPLAQGVGARILWRRVLKALSSLKLAIAEMAAIAGLSAVGTVIPQNEVRRCGLEEGGEAKGALRCLREDFRDAARHLGCNVWEEGQGGGWRSQGGRRGVEGAVEGK